MRLQPADIATYFKYHQGQLVGVEYCHTPTGIKSGVQPTRDDADRVLRDKLAGEGYGRS